MKRRNDKEIKRMDALFNEIGASEPCIPLEIKDAKFLSAERDTENRFNHQFSEKCQKMVYASAKYAERVALYRRKHGAGKLRVYKCENCHGFHLSSYIQK